MNCIPSVPCGEPYLRHSHTQEIRVKELCSDVSILTYRNQLPCKGRIHTNTDTLVGEFQKSLYGFKPHAIQLAIDKGYKKIIWFDPSVLPTTSVQILFDALDEHQMVVVKGDAPLSKMTNQKAKDWFGVTDEQIAGINHIGGTVYCFNFNNKKVVEVFNLWKKAEEAGIFQNQDAFMKGDHWCDESCMALSMFKCGVNQYSESNFRYI